MQQKKEIKKRQKKGNMALTAVGSLTSIARAW